MKHVLPGLAALLISMGALAQTGTVSQYTKVSQSEGNFSADLPNQAQMGYLSDAAGSGSVITAAPHQGNGAFYFTTLDEAGGVSAITAVHASDFALFDTSSGLRFGESVVQLHDQNGDLQPDFVVGAPGYDSRGGLFYVQSADTGYTCQPIPLPAALDSATGVGSELAADGDLLLVHSSHAAGTLYRCTLAAPAALSVEEIIDSTHPLLSGLLDTGDRFGEGMSTADIDGDGVSDLLCGAPGDDDQDSNFGAVYQLFRDASGALVAVQKISRLAGDFGGFLNSDDDFGVSVRCIGDLDQDGHADLAVGAPGDDDGGFDTGSIWILFMHADHSVKNEKKINRFEGNFDGGIAQQDRFGTRIALLGDHNQDGTVDLAVGAPMDDDGGANRGAFFTLFIEYCPAPSGFFTYEVQGPTVQFFAEGGPTFTHIWNFDDGGYSEQQNPTHTYESPGTYWVCLAINNDCGGNNYCQNVQVSTVVGVEERSLAGFELRPNPAYQSVQLKAHTSIELLQIHDITGKLIVERRVNAEQVALDVSALTPGVYLVTLLSSDQRRAVRKLQVH